MTEIVLLVHDRSALQDDITESIRRENIIVFEAKNTLDCLNFLDIVIPNLIIICTDSALNKMSVHKMYAELLSHHVTSKVPVLVYDRIDEECLLYWRKIETNKKDIYVMKNYKLKQILETVRKLISIQNKQIEMTESQFTKFFGKKF